MGAHESMEQAEHAEHASGANKKIALLIAVIALFLALSETLGKGAQTESISKNVEASNLWAFFQAKSIRRTVVAGDFGAVQIEPRRDGRRCRQGGAAKADRRLAEDRGALPLGAGHRRRHRSNWPHAPSTPRKSATWRTAKYHHYEIASAAFQIGIVLASATIITGMIALAWISGLLAVAGLAFTAIGLFAPHAVHLM